MLPTSSGTASGERVGGSQTDQRGDMSTCKLLKGPVAGSREKVMRMAVREEREVVGPLGEEARTRRYVAVGYLAVVLRTVRVIVSRNESSVVVVEVEVEVMLWGAGRGRLDAGERLGLKGRRLVMALAVTKRVLERGRRKRLESGCMACRICR